MLSSLSSDVFEQHINGTPQCDLSLLDAFIIFERVGRGAVPSHGLLVRLMSFSTDQAPGRTHQTHACVGMPAVGIVAHFQRNPLCFPEAPAPVNRRESVASTAVRHTGEHGVIVVWMCAGCAEIRGADRPLWASVSPEAHGGGWVRAPPQL